jgi:xylose isomerase
LNTGGCNFDAKLRRQSIDPNDLYIAHISGIDTLARSLLAAESIIKEKRLAKLREERYAGWSGPLGKKILAGDFTLQTLADHAVKTNLDPKPKSGRQELFEEIVANHCKF